METVNIINNKPYTVRFSAEKNPFEVGIVVLGGLVSWNGDWYWSGIQHSIESITQPELHELIESFIRECPKIVYRYSSGLAEKAKEANDHQYQEFLKYYGDDLVIYPDGLSMAADYQQRFRLQWKFKPEETVKAVMDKYKLKDPQPNMPIPRNLLDSDNGIGVYYNPDEGLEIMTGFNPKISAYTPEGEVTYYGSRGAGNTHVATGREVGKYKSSQHVTPGFLPGVSFYVDGEMIIDNGKILFFNDPELRKVAEKYGDPDELFTQVDVK